MHALYSPLGLSLAHICLSTYFILVEFIYAFYSVYVSAFSTYLNIDRFYTRILYMLFTAFRGLPLAHILTCLIFS